MIKPISTPWNSLIWTESPLKDSFRLADLSQGPAKKVVGKEGTPSSESPRGETPPQDSFESVDVSRKLYIKSLLG